MAYVTLGFWLPVGKANFFHTLEDNNIESKPYLNTETPSVFNRIYRSLIDKNRSFDTHVIIAPNRRENYLDDTDPYVTYFFSKKTIANNKITNIILRVDCDGFYTLFGKYNPKGSLGKRMDETEAFAALKEYLVNNLIEGDVYLKTTSLESDYKGILNFFQLNLILEGLFNYNFDPDIYFRHEEMENSSEKNYTLRKFFEQIIAFIPYQDFLENVDQLFRSMGSDDFSRAVYEFERNIDSGFDDNSLVDKTDNINDVPNKMKLFGSDLIRRFTRNTSTLCLQPIKWNVEASRRFLLRETISILHRRQPIDQLENLRNRSFQRIDQANLSQVKGYILLVSAKFPVLLNVSHYLNNLMQDYGNKEGMRNTFSFVNNWNSLVSGISANISGIESAIENVRMEKILYELEELRAEQEAETEQSRAQEHLEWQSDLDEAESIKLSTNSVMLALLGIILTIIIYPSEIASFLLPPNVYNWLLNLSEEWRYVLGLAVLFIVPFAAYSLIRYLERPLRSLSLRIDKYRSSEKIPKYQFEIDARIDMEVAHEGYGRLLKCDFDFEQGSLEKKIKHLTFEKPRNNAYRIETPNADESLIKYHLTTNMVWDEAVNLKKPQMKCHIIYEILVHKISNNYDFVLREVRFLAYNRGFLNMDLQNELTALVETEFIKRWLIEKEKSLMLTISHEEKA